MGDAQQPLSITFTACVAWSGAAWEKVKNPIYRALPCRKRPYCEQHWAISAWGRWEPGEEKEVGGEDTQALKRHPKAEMSELMPKKSPVGWHQWAQKPRGKAEDEQDKEVRTKRGVPSPLLWGGRRWMLPNTATPEEDTAGNQHQQETELKAMEIKEEETLPLHPLPPPPPLLCLSPVGGSAPSQHCGQLKPHTSYKRRARKTQLQMGTTTTDCNLPGLLFSLKHGNQSRIVCMRFRDRESCAQRSCGLNPRDATHGFRAPPAARSIGVEKEGIKSKEKEKKNK